ncbi:hypothetical protein E5K00_13290 [Hymenobacter aquaticus]|uniref:Uncharacterized protein n=1 Tax=Hymenobacter aquaticus TaxID=1867101 RepID=A0A4Z0PWJ0_9BACT|nr:DUF6252 family protein [Hymenobacter aquaticus]TGE21263.1 hypothetical protein E5K00_13290 [Hymenobacter aquaticus]
MTRYLLYAALLLLTQCSKCKQDDPSPESQLPPATQTGANTFGCLVNGQVYLPSGNNGTANYAVLYDPGFQGGSLDIIVYSYSAGNNAQYLSFGGNQVASSTTFPFGTVSNSAARYSDAGRKNGCTRYASDDGVTSCKGQFTITRLDLTAGIISGTFAFTLAQPGCDTIKVTQGRFDKKL